MLVGTMTQVTIRRIWLIPRMSSDRTSWKRRASAVNRRA